MMAQKSRNRNKFFEEKTMTSNDVVRNLIGSTSSVSGMMGFLIGAYAQGDQEMKMALLVIGPVLSLAGIMILRNR